MKNGSTKAIVLQFPKRAQELGDTQYSRETARHFLAGRSVEKLARDGRRGTIHVQGDVRQYMRELQQRIVALTKEAA